MKKIIVSALLIACVLSTQQVDAALINTNTIEGDSCVKFTENLYYAKDTWLKTVAGYTNIDAYDTLSELTTKQVKRLHKILELEGFEIPSKEKSINQYGRGTTIAVAGLQNKYKAELLTSQGLTYSYGVIDEKGVEFLNQKYGCLDKVSVKFQEQGKVINVVSGTEQQIGYVITGVPNKVSVNFTVVDPSNKETALSTIESKNGKGTLTWKASTTRGVYTIRAKINGTLFSEVQYNVATGSVISDVIATTPWYKNDGKVQKVTFNRATIKGAVHACLVPAATTANGFVSDSLYLGSTDSTSILIADSKISSVSNGEYKVLVTSSSKKCKTNIAMTAVSNTITVDTKATSNTTTNTTADTTTNTSSNDLDTSTAGSVDNSRTFEFVRPTTDTSVKAGVNLGLRIRIGSVENIPNRARGSAYLIDPNGTETKLKEGYIYYCATATSDCVGFRSPYGLSATVPAGTAAGSGYKVRLDIPVDGVTVSKTSPAFTVTN